MQAWMVEEVQVIVATNAFEWDRQTNVKTVIHIHYQNMENYYQEAGRRT
jgi:superfamily II DNA helicase RecQ